MTAEHHGTAVLSRKLMGRSQTGGRGADVFLADEGGEYIGRG
jgi:hypothetical protein